MSWNQGLRLVILPSCPLRCAAAALLVFAVVWGSGRVAHAQPAGPAAYDALPITDAKYTDEKTRRTLEQQKNAIIRGALALEGNQALFDSWYRDYFFRSFTQPSELGKLAEKRRALLDDLRLARTKQVHDRLLHDLVFYYMKGFVQTQKYKFHPAVRVNAMLIIGELNRTEASLQQRYADPLPEALDFMLAEFQNPAQSDAVRVAAQIGILRHATYDRARPPAQRISTATRSAIVREMLAVVKAKDPPAGRSREGHHWIQQRGIEILAALGAVGPVEEVNRAIEEMVTDQKAPMSLRCTAASALIHVETQQKTSIDPADLALKLGALAVQICHKELDRIAEQEKREREKQATGGGAYFAGGMYAPEAGGMYAPEAGGMYAPEAGGMMPGAEAMPGGVMPGAEGGMPADAGMPGGVMPGAEGGMPGDAGMLPGMPGGVMPGAEGMPGGVMPGAVVKDPRLETPRRRFKHQLVSVQTGLKGLAQLATAEPAKSRVAAIVAQVDAVLKATDVMPPDPTKRRPSYGKKTDPKKSKEQVIEVTNVRGLVLSVTEAIRQLEEMTQSLLPAEPAATPVSEEPVADVPPPAPAAAPAAPSAPAPGSSPPATKQGAARPTAPAPKSPGTPGPAAPAAPAAPAKPGTPPSPAPPATRP